MIPQTIYLLTVESGDYHKYPVTIRAYASNGQSSALQKLMRRLDRHYANKPNTDEEENPDWWNQLCAWQEKHPLGSSYGHADRGDFKIESMRLR